MSHNFGKKDGHEDEYNPSRRTNFRAKKYNIKPRFDITIPAYSKERDSYPSNYNLTRNLDPSIVNNNCGTESIKP